MEQIIGTAGCAALGFCSGAAGVGLVVLAHRFVVEPTLRVLSAVRAAERAVRPRLGEAVAG